MPARILSSPHKVAMDNAVVKKCLKCSKEFKSLGPGNRICERCNGENQNQARRRERGGTHQRIVSKKD